MSWGVEPQICKWTQIVLIFFFFCFPHRDGSFRKSHIGRIISALQIQGQESNFKASTGSWMLTKLILIFTKMGEINAWEVTRYFLSIAFFLDAVQLQISSQNQTSPALQRLSRIKTEITPSKRHRKRWLRNGSSAVWQRRELPARRESSIAPSSGWLRIKRARRLPPPSGWQTGKLGAAPWLSKNIPRHWKRLRLFSDSGADIQPAPFPTHQRHILRFRREEDGKESRRQAADCVDVAGLPNS